MFEKKENRRNFLKRSALAVGAFGVPALVPSSILGQSRPAPSERIGMGFIGVGARGTSNMKNFLERDEVQVLAVCDCNRDGTNYQGERRCGRIPAKEIVEKKYGRNATTGTYKGCDATNDFRDLLMRSDIDAVMIGTPDHWHAYLAIEAAKAGKDIYCEKPLARSIHEGKEMLRTMKLYSRVFQTGSQQRSDGRFRHACELALNGYLGEIKTVYARVGGLSKPCDLGPGGPVPAGFDYQRWLGPAPQAPYHPDRVSGSFSTNGHSWRSYEPYSAGGLSDWGAHNFDIAQWGLGMDESGPTEITPPTPENGLEELTLTYASGVQVVKKAGPHKGMVQFIGTKGWVGVNRGSIFASDDALLKLKMKPSDTHLYVSNDHYQNFLDCVKTRKTPVCDISVGYHSMLTYLLGEIALRLKRSIKWNPKTETIIGDPEATAMMRRQMRPPWIV